MAFNSLTIGANTFNSVGNSLYRLSTVAFGGLDNDVKLVRGVRSKAGITTASLTRRIMKEVTVNGIAERRVMSITVNMTVPDGFTAAEADSAVTDLDTWCSTGNLTRLFMGES